MRSLKVEMLHAKKSETVNFGILPRGGLVLRLCELFQSRFKWIVLCGKYYTVVNLFG